MSLGADDGQTARFPGFWRELNVGTTTGHVGGYRYGARLTGHCHDFRFPLVLLGIQHVVGNFPELQHSAQHFADFH